MNNVKQKPAELTLGGRSFFVEFNLNVLSEVQDRYENVGAINQKIQQYKELKWLLTLLVNEMLDDESQRVTEQWVGKQISLKNMAGLVSVISQAFAASLPESDDEIEEDLDPNVLTKQG